MNVEMSTDKIEREVLIAKLKIIEELKEQYFFEPDEEIFCET